MISASGVGPWILSVARARRLKLVFDVDFDAMEASWAINVEAVRFLDRNRG